MKPRTHPVTVGTATVPTGVYVTHQPSHNVSAYTYDHAAGVLTVVTGLALFGRDETVENYNAWEAVGHYCEYMILPRVNLHR